MTKIIVKAKKNEPSLKETYKIGDRIVWGITHFDGRGYITRNYKGEIVKVNKVTVDTKDDSGNVWRVDVKDII